MRPPTNMALKRRMEATFIFLMVLFFALVVRLTWIQGVKHDFYVIKARNFHGRKLKLFAARGKILDRNDQEIVSNVEGKTLIANPRAVQDKQAAAQQIAAHVGGNPDHYLHLLQQDTYKDGKPRWFTYLARAADRSRVEQLLGLKIPGLEAEPEPRRVHPFGSLAAHVTGFVNADGKGCEGLERTENALLQGKDGELRTDVDAIGRPIPDTDQFYQPAVNGGAVKLTIDSNIQQFAEAELKKIMDTFAPEGATAIVLDTRTGEILALANAPTFDPNHPANGPVQNRRNRAIQDRYEPGSTFKTLTIAAALEEHLPNTTVFCGGSLGIGHHTIKCAHGAHHGHVGLHEIEQFSCNVGAATIGRRLGADTLYKYIKRFGYLDKTGVELSGEERGSVGGMKPEDWPDIKTANVAFGQGVVVTPLSIVRMYATFANDGVMLPPTILQSVNGKLHRRPEPPRRVVSPQTAHTVRDFMESVVVGKHGTGHNAKIPNYTVAGKTGTAQFARNGHYVHGAYVSSFIGFLPATRPRIAILVTATHPTKNGSYGGTVAAPAFREIARQTMAYLHVPPDAPGDFRDGAHEATTFANYERQHGGSERLPSEGSEERHATGGKHKAGRKYQVARSQTPTASD
jgi:cell division protein FtsI/penicillin-binding protein 2